MAPIFFSWVFTIFATMWIDAYIRRLLYRYNCVIVPGFGAFLVCEKSAEINDATHMLLPPSKSISFNAQLCKNDGLLVAEIAKDQKRTYEALLREVEQLSETWKEKLENGESITLTGIGKLWRNEAQKIQFQPEDKINYLTASFGLSSFIAIPVQRETLKAEIEVLEEQVPLTLTPEKRNTSFRPWLKYAATVLLLVSLGTALYRTYGDIQLKQVTAQQDTQQQVSRIIQEATFFDSDPLKLPHLNIEITKKQLGKYYVIAGAFRIKRNAERRIQQLKDKGYKGLYLGQNQYGLHQVAYDRFEDPEKALIFLRKARATESADAWLLSEK